MAARVRTLLVWTAKPNFTISPIWNVEGMEEAHLRALIFAISAPGIKLVQSRMATADVMACALDLRITDDESGFNPLVLQETSDLSWLHIATQPDPTSDPTSTPLIEPSFVLVPPAPFSSPPPHHDEEGERAPLLQHA